VRPGRCLSRSRGDDNRARSAACSARFCFRRGCERLASASPDGWNGRSPAARDRPPLTPALPGRSRCLCEMDLCFWGRLEQVRLSTTLENARLSHAERNAATATAVKSRQKCRWIAIEECRSRVVAEVAVRRSEAVGRRRRVVAGGAGETGRGSIWAVAVRRGRCEAI
jgi:hypothetical protein